MDVGATLALLTAQSVLAGNGALVASPWTVSVTPYLWLPWLQADVRLKGFEDRSEALPWSTSSQAKGA
jgi:hypothetical protein